MPANRARAVAAAGPTAQEVEAPMRDHPTTERGYCECGCGERTRLATQVHVKFGYAIGEPLRFIHGHNTYPRFCRDPLERFQLNVRSEDRGFRTECLIWASALNNQGYGMFSVMEGDRRRNRLAHRWHWERVNGSISDGLQLDHLCVQTDCVRLDHLEPVTATENVRRGRRTKLSLTLARAMYVRLQAGESNGVLAREFGVSSATVSRIHKNGPDGPRNPYRS